MIDQQSLRAQINKRNSSIIHEKEHEQSILVRLGNAVHNSGDIEGLAEDLVHSILKGKGDVSELTTSQRQLLGIEESGIALTDEIKKLNVELRNLNNRKPDCMEELARRAWAFWKSNEGDIEGLESALDELVKADEHLNSVEDAVSRNAMLLGNLGGSILSKGRALFLAGRRRTATATIDRLWQIVGVKVYSTLNEIDIQGTSIEESYGAIVSIEDRKQRIEEDLLIMDTNREHLDADMEKMPGKGGLHKRLSLLEKAISESHCSLDDAYRKLGAAWLASEKEQALSPDVERYRGESIEVHNRITQFEVEIHALESHCEFQGLKLELNKHDNSVSSLDAKIKTYQSQLKAAKKEFSRVSKKMEKVKEALPPLPEILK